MNMLIRPKVRMALAALAVAGGGAVAAFVGPAGPAAGQSSPPVQVQIQLGSPATLVARGAGADITVTASCSGPVEGPAALEVKLSERVATANGFATINCTGTSQTITVLVTPPIGRVLKKGTALATATITVCGVNPGFCGIQQAQLTIQVTS
jgi:hypothetical protein